ncbi:MAG: RNA recognition motif domain-containing protein [Verrucomicrobiales bacterium]
MSNTTENQSRSSGPRRSGSSRQNNRNRNGRGGNNRNRRGGNQNRNRQSQGRQGQQGRQSGGGPRENRRPEPPKLTFWQKLLKMVGLYQEPPRARRPQKKFDQERSSQKGNRSGGRKPRGPRSTPNPEDINGKRLYVGNLSFDANETDLEELFSGVGKVRSVDIVYNSATHRSKGFGFVEMNHIDESRRAVEVLHDQPFMGRQLIVNEAKSKGPAEGAEQDNSEETSGEEENA